MLKIRNVVTSMAFLTTLFVSGHAFALSAAEFVEKATIGGQFEVESSKTALQTSQSAGVKQLAQMMVDDHTAANDTLKAVVSENHIDVPAPVNMDSKHQNMLDKLNEAKGADFDKLYVKDQIAAHKEAITLFSKYAKSGDDSHLKSFAKKTLPKLRMHLKNVMAVNASMKL